MTHDFLGRVPLFKSTDNRIQGNARAADAHDAIAIHFQWWSFRFNDQHFRSPHEIIAPNGMLLHDTAVQEKAAQSGSRANGWA
jgi:hypothetical protein